MEYYQDARMKKWVGLVVLFVLFFIQIWFTGLLQVDASSSVLGYRFSFASQYKLTFWGIVGIFIFSTGFVYIATFLIVTSQTEEFVLIYGKHSLYSKFKNWVGESFDPANINKDQIKKFVDESEFERPEEYENYIQIALISKQLMDKANANIVERIYIGRSNIANAFTIRVIPIPYLGQDWIIVNKNLIDILEFNEIEAVISHEIGHVRNFDSWMSLLFYYPRILMSFAWFYLVITMLLLIFVQPFTFLLFIVRIITFVIVLAIISRITYLTAKINSIVSQNTELMADYFAIEQLVSAEILTNALVKLGQRGEVIREIREEIEWLESRQKIKSVDEMVLDAIHFLDPTEMNPEKGRDLALEYYVSNQLTRVLELLMLTKKVKKQDELINQSITALKKERKKKDKEKIGDRDLTMNQIKKLTKDWRESDLNNDNYLERDEIKHLVESMRESGQEIFETDVLIDMNIIPTERTHPPISKRVEYLYETFLRDPVGDRKENISE